MIRTDHQSLKYLLKQEVQTNLQKKSISCLMGLNFVIEYRRGVENKTTFALSRIVEKQESASISLVTLEW